MAGILGSLLVELGVNTAAFKGGLDKATYQAKQWAGEQRAALSGLSNSFSQLGASVGASFGPAGGIVSALTQGMGSLLKATQAAAGGAGALGALTIATAGVGAAAAAVVGTWASLAVGGAHYVEQLTRMSEKTGISVKDLQTLKAAGESVDIPLESMQRGFRTLSRALVEGSEGTSRASKTLHNLGVTAHEPYEAMLQIADGISKVKDPMLRAADATAVFGARIGLSMLPLLEKGREGIEEWGDIVDVFGAKIDAQAKIKTDEWKESTVKLSTAWDGLKVSALGILPAITAVTDEMAIWVRAASHIESFSNSLKDIWSVITTEKLSDDVTKQLESQAAAAKAYATQQAAAANAEADRKDKIREVDEHAFNLVKDGGKAGAALKEAELKISQDIADEDYKDAAVLQAKIPALKDAADLERKRTEALLTTPRETKKAIDAQDVSTTKSYADAIKSLGPAYAEESRQLENAAAMEKFINKQRESGIYGTKIASDAADAYASSLDRTSRAKEAFSKGGAFAKAVSEELIKLDEEANKSDRASSATSKLAKVDAEYADQIDAVNRKKTEAIAIFNTEMSSDKLSEDEKKNLIDSLAKEIGEYDKIAAAVERAAAAKKLDITTDAFKAEQTQIQQKERLIELLRTETYEQAKAQASAEVSGGDTGLGLKDQQLKDYIALKMQEVDLDKQSAAAERASTALSGHTEQIQAAQALVQELMKQKAAFLAAGGSVAYYNQQLAIANKDVADLQAKGGTLGQDLSKCFSDFAASTKTVGQAISSNITTALNGVATGLAKTIVEGKNFGQAMRRVAQEVLESFIENEIKRLTVHAAVQLGLTTSEQAGVTSRVLIDKEGNVKTIMGYAKEAASAGWAAGAKFPPPLNVIMAPALAGLFFTGALAYASFDQGGIVEHTGMAKVHENEMVLPRPISEKVQKMADGGGNAGSRGGLTVHYSPTVHAVDGKGVGDMLNSHGQLFTQYLTKELRRRNML